MNLSAGRPIVVIAGVALSVACLAIAASWVSWHEFSEAFRNFSYEWLLLAFALQFSTLMLRVCRWRIMFLERLPFDALFWTQAVGYLVNNLLPLRLGDLARIMLLRLLVSVSAFRIGYTIVMERFLDIAMTLLVLALAAAYARVSGDLWAAASLFFAAAAALFVLGASAYVYGRRRGEQIATPILRKTFVEFVRAVDATFRNQPGPALFLSAACVVFSTLMVWAVLRGFDPGATLWTAMVITVAITFALAIPSAPANVGTFQLVGQAAIVTFFGERYSPASALAIVTVIHLVHFVGTSLLGIAGIWWLRGRLGKQLTFRDLLHKLLHPAS